MCATVVLLGTQHEEQGCVTPAALHAILETIRPEVIFLEIPVAVFPDFDDGTRSSLESYTARLYRETHSVALVPVDLPTPHEQFFRDWQYMDRLITAVSPLYRDLVDQNTLSIAAGGFAYLNSDAGLEVWPRVYEAMEEALALLPHNTRLAEIYHAWRGQLHSRDHAMLREIASYCRSQPFSTGVLLVGNAHLRSLLDKSAESNPSELPQVQLWSPSIQ